MKKNNQIAILGLILFLFISLNAKSSKDITEVYEQNLDDVDQITIKGNFSVYLNQNEKTSLTIKGPKKELRNIIVKVKSNALSIEQEKTSNLFSKSPHFIIELNLSQIEMLKIDGSVDLNTSKLMKGNSFFLDIGGLSKIDFNELKYDKIKVICGGASEVILRGNCDKLWIKLDGAGLVDGQNLKASDAYASCNGLGNIIVNSDNFLQATIDGIGSIQYLGNPQIIKKSVDGLGTISPYN